MVNNNQESYIEGIDELKETVRRIVSERVYGMVQESIYEQYFESDEKEDDSEEKEKEAKHTDAKEKTGDKEIAKQRNQVTTMLRDPKINMAELGRDLYPDMSDDAARSLISKKSRGVRELTPEEVITLYQKLRGTRVTS